ncbi:sulfatase-like hydrolase/transferase [Psychrobacter sp. SMN/5/1215-MNA-CIBAN-0208]|uniref:sulfatase-like hydrolase/transferase n=1 Tax=Psychrobacter sp. SMN/5/1215-MNA-CIBAN-0208 TaxID=3140442 RepID=UPI003318398B
MYDSKQLKALLASVSIILMPNMIMMLLAYLTDTNRLLINIDYFIPLLLLAYRKRVLFVIVFIIISLFDFLALFTQLFPFIRLSDLVYLSKFAFISSSSYQLYGITLIVLIIVQSYLYLKIYKTDYNKTLLIIFNIIILYYAYSINFMDNSSRSFLKVDTNIVGSQSISNIDYISSGFIQTYTMEGAAFQKSKATGATADLFNHPDSRDKVLLVVNEAWGVTTDASVQNDVLSPILNEPAASNTKQETLDFVGVTLAGELRELCAKAPIHFNLKNQIQGFEDCLPNHYKSLGYHTVAVHGAIGFMYDRQYWYPRAGFEQMLFRDQGLNIPDSRCYSFPGNCDSDIADRVVEQFNNNDKLFLYWLTLNTHAIYDTRDLETDLFDCSQYDIEADTATCRNLKLQKQFFYILSQMIADPALSGTRVIVVGDHEPPLIEEDSNVFVKGKVPIIEFETN